MGNQIYRCGICFEAIDSKTRFGLLSACDHVFCFECLRRWVEQQDEIRCPACRRVSQVMVPNKCFLTGTAKSRYIRDPEFTCTCDACTFRRRKKIFFWVVVCVLIMILCYFIMALPFVPSWTECLGYFSQPRYLSPKPHYVVVAYWNKGPVGTGN